MRGWTVLVRLRPQQRPTERDRRYLLSQRGDTDLLAAGAAQRGRQADGMRKARALA